MNAMLTIEVRLLSQEAIAQAKALQGALKTVQTSTSGAGAAAASSGRSFGTAMTNLEQFGKNLQWTGRQLTYNFTLPLALAGGVATKFALDNDKAMTNVRKSYEAFGASVTDRDAELNALSRTFELLSNRFGVAQKDVIGIGYAWAQAGAGGVALAKATKLTLETMALTGEDAASAQNQLMTVQSAYRFNTEQLRDAMVKLNAVQVTTAIDFGGLIDAVSRAGGVAASAGIDIDHLAAMAASLVPATGSAAAAGNALRTIISRVMAPTKQAADEMKLFGINVTDASWQAKNGVDRIMALAQAYNNLSDAQKVQVATVIGSRWQINRLDILFKDLASDSGVYAKALGNTGDMQKANAQYAQMLATVLGSTSQGFQILKVNIENALAKAIAPLLPAIIGVMKGFLTWITAFTNLDPHIQQLILGLLVVLALVGPITKYIGAFTTLFGLLGSAIATATGFLFGMSEAEMAVLTATEAANVGFLEQYGIIGGLGQLISFIFLGIPQLVFKGIWAMVAGIGEAIGGVTAFIAGVPEAIAAAFASPWVGVVLVIAAAVALLVAIFHEQLGAVVQWVIDAFNKLPQAVVNVFKSIIEVIKNAATSIAHWLSFLNPFARHSPSLVDNVQKGSKVIQGHYSTMNDSVQDQIGQAQQTHQEFQNATSDLAGTKTATKAQNIIQVLPNSADAVWAMVKAMDALQASTDKANAAVKEQQALVDNMKKQIDTDMKPYTDAIFANEEAQKKLKLAIMQAEDAAGGSLDSIKQKIAMAQGQIESLTAEKKDLRLAGAGSDILSGFDEQIGAARAQQSGLRQKADEIQKLQDQLDKLQRTGEELNLEKDIKFDPQLQALQEQQDKLDELKKTYDDLNNQLQDMKQSFDAIASAADAAISAAKAAAGSDSLNAEQFAAGAGANFPDVTGDTVPGLGTEGGLPEIQDFNTQLQDELNKALDNMGSFDVFAPLKDAWDAAWKWIKEKVGPYVEPVIKAIEDWFSNLNLGDMDASSLLTPFEAIADWFEHGPISTGLSKVMLILGSFWELIKSVGGTLGEIFLPIFRLLGDEFSKFGDMIGSELSKWAPVWGKLMEAAGHIFNVLMDIAGPALALFILQVRGVLLILRGIWEAFWPILENVLKPVLDNLIGLIKGFMEIIRGAISFVLDLINGDWGKAWDDVKTIFAGVWDSIYAVFSATIGVIIGLVEGFIKGVVDFFTFLYDTLIGHSIIPDLVNGIITYFQLLFDTVSLIWNVLWTAIQIAWDTIGKPVFDVIVAVVTSLMNDVFVPIFGLLATLWSDFWTGVQVIWDTIGSLVFAAVVLIINSLMNDVFVPVFATLATTWSDFWTGLGVVWTTVGQPIFDLIVLIVTGFKDSISTILTGINNAWDWAWGLVKATWDTVGQPVFDAIAPVITGVGLNFGAVKDAVTTAWSDLWNGLKWTWEAIGRPIFDGIIWVVELLKGAFDTARIFISTVWDDITGAIGSARDFFIGAYNMIANGVNAVLGFLHLDSLFLPTVSTGGGGGSADNRQQSGAFATGGILDAMPMMGGITNQIRAIVGEGSDFYPEYVIPTDPQYRANAMALIVDLLKKIPMMAGGGFVSPVITTGGAQAASNTAIEANQLLGVASDAFNSAWDIMGNVPGHLGDMGRQVISMLWDKAWEAMTDAIGKIGSGETQDWEPWGRLAHALGFEAGGIVPSLLNGGVVLPRPGGTLVRLGEGSNAEMVKPLPNGMNEGDTYNFYGNLSFPNITKPDDAKKFLKNLEDVGTR